MGWWTNPCYFKLARGCERGGFPSNVVYTSFCYKGRTSTRYCCDRKHIVHFILVEVLCMCWMLQH